ncbi:MAG TPA: alpha/beta hydrolase [Herpetosiphonaceae bacterium]
MPIDPQMQAFLDQQAALGAPPIHKLTPEQVRSSSRLQLQQAALYYTPEQVAKIENRTIEVPTGEIPVRIYTPEGDGPFPLLVFFHGGGWVIGDLDSHDDLCRALTNAVGCVVFAVGYRLAPEHKFPAATEDCYAAAEWVIAHAAELNADPDRVAVGGDSAGGNLAAVVTMMARDRGGPRLSFQLLIYPATDFSTEFPSREENAAGPVLDTETMIWFRDHYLNGEADMTNPLASPLLASDFHSLPPALVITAEYDPLRDEGEAYAEQLKAAGVPATVRRYDGLIHGFFSFGVGVDKVRQAMAETAGTLREAFSTAG